MARFYERFVQPGYFHLMRGLRFLVFPLGAAGGAAYGAGVLGLPDGVQIGLWVLGLAIGLASWALNYSGESATDDRE